MANLSTWGNRLHSGEKTYAIVGKRQRFFAISGVLMTLALLILLIKGLNPGIDFRGGTEYTLSGVENTDTTIAVEVVNEALPSEEPRVAQVGTDGIRVQLGELEQAQVDDVAAQLAEAYGIDQTEVSSSFIGPTWGEDVSSKAVQGLVIFLLLVTVVMTLYFRAWRMAAAALVALGHDLLFTAGIYALSGFEVTPASVIGFLTILGYSLYDTVVVFDKVRENTADLFTQHRYTYAEMANLAVNQTLVRSINTSVVALLPVSAILFIGSYFLGAGTLKDISLALFVGMAVGTYSSIFVATPLEVALRGNEARIKEHTAAVLALRESGESDVIRPDGTVRVGALTPGHHQGTQAQPRRKRRK
ncbi:protein translocase subunit SecF [Demequina sp. TTPB684]|uniref:protein translocase subunit SecF n=1 Tax=unclassified Demequina TaxID=2620311 RepID=UPI001CF43440|nr:MULTISPECIES: protein translocase subunit SecF [unclassified Demequina]MCB2414074.1 protein translocase subunit SecF [Demequina sp. TTPB684]UPU89215.1 protein translocase subunit SecF [Demequina sp. TMPB413]